MKIKNPTEKQLRHWKRFAKMGADGGNARAAKLSKAQLKRIARLGGKAGGNGRKSIQGK